MMKKFLIDDFGENSMIHKLSENSKKLLTDILRGVILDTFENHPGRKGGGSRPRGTGKNFSGPIKLGKREFHLIHSAINTVYKAKYKQQKGKTCYIFAGDNFYVFKNIDFDDYIFLRKIPIEENEDLIDLLTTLKGGDD